MHPQGQRQGEPTDNRNKRACPYIQQRKNIRINGVDWHINKQLNSLSYNIVMPFVAKKTSAKKFTLARQK